MRAKFKAFICHSSKNSKYVLEVKRFLDRNFASFCYEKEQPVNEPFWDIIKHSIYKSNLLIVFVGSTFTENQLREVKLAYGFYKKNHPYNFIFCLLDGNSFPKQLVSQRAGKSLRGFTQINIDTKEKDPIETAKDIVNALKLQFKYDGLPTDPNLFSYEKHIIEHFINIKPSNRFAFSERDRLIHERFQKGCPEKWPEVPFCSGPTRSIEEEYGARLHQENNSKIIEERVKKWIEKVGGFRDKNNKVIVAALTGYHDLKNQELPQKHCKGCCFVNTKPMICFPEAGPRKFIFFPRDDRNIKKETKLRVGILVSGGIAPGTNAVIDGIVQRHRLYAQEFGYSEHLDIRGIKNGFLAFDNWGDEKITIKLKDLNTASRANEGGSLLGTSRLDDLLNIPNNENSRYAKLHDIVSKLYADQYDILYIIGGDGSMKAAHALWTIAREHAKEVNRPELSVVAIPKTMDNDILWVWQSFGFLSAVEKAREIIDNLATEVESNPRLCVIQLFGSDSGFVVSHAVLASRPKQVDAALIPEIDFSLEKLAEHLREKMSERRNAEFISRGLVVMAENAIPSDAEKYIDDSGIDLNDKEKTAIKDYLKLKKNFKRIQGQTQDELRSGGLKIVSRGLLKLLKNEFNPRIVTNEPRHLLRALPPSCTDIIMGNRLGTLAVDNAIAGYTDYMISQWLTEYVLVPLDLVVLGRKRIPSGIFWKSVIAKTGQPAKLEEETEKVPDS